MAIKANAPRNPKGPSKDQKDHYSPTRRLDDKVKDPSGGKMGESYKKQEHAKAAARSNIGGIGSETENVSAIKDLAVKESHSAYRNQDHAEKGMHGGSAETKGSLIGSPTVERGRAYAGQAKASDAGTKADLALGDCLSGEEGKYLGHFRNDKYLRDGHNSDGYVPMGPGMSSSEAERTSKPKKIDMEKNREMDAKDFARKNKE